MRVFTLFLFVMFCFDIQAQNEERRYYDFSEIDVENVDRERLRRSIDSTWRSSPVDSLLQLHSYVEANRYKSGYFSFDIGYESSTASLKYLNVGLQSLGLGEITETFAGIPFGFSLKSNRWLFSYLVAPGISQSTSNNDYHVKVDGMAADLTAAYDLVNAKRFQLLPFLRIGLQGFDIEVLRKAALDDITDVSSLIPGLATTRLERNSLALTYGLEADYHLVYSDASGGVVLAFKYGYATDLAPGKWKINKEKTAFSLSDRIRESSFVVMVRFYMKT